MSDEVKIRKVNIKTDGLSKEEILTVVHSHVVACQKAVAMLWASHGEGEDVNALRDALQGAERASR
jgi:hypothetical protein